MVGTDPTPSGFPAITHTITSSAEDEGRSIVWLVPATPLNVSTVVPLSMVPNAADSFIILKLAS